MLNLSSFFIAEELRKRGYSVSSFYDEDMLLIERDGKRAFSHSSKTTLSATSYLLCKDKYLSKELLSRHRFPTAKGVLITQSTLDAVKELTFPIVLKPLFLTGGIGVVVNINSIDEVKNYIESHLEYDQVLAEEMLEGVDTRLLVVRGKFFAACQREPASIVGDGIHTLAEIISTENQRRVKTRQQQEKDGVWTEDIFPILFDKDCERCIEKSGFTLESVIEKNRKIFVRSNSNVASGGSSVDVTDDVCKEIRELAENVARAFATQTIGIDIMSERVDVALEKQSKSGIVEVNGSPGLSLHVLTHIGKRRNPVPLIVDELEETFFKHV